MKTSALKQVYLYCLLSSLYGYAALHSVLCKTEPILDSPASMVDQVSRSMTTQYVQLKDLVHVYVKPATLPQKKNTNKKNTTPLNVLMAEAHLQTPPVLCGNKKYILKTNGKKKTAPTDIHVACKQPKLQYGIERVLSLKS